MLITVLTLFIVVYLCHLFSVTSFQGFTAVKFLMIVL
jgi:hypothetical protein